MSTTELKTHARAIQQALAAAFGPSPAATPSPFTAAATGVFLASLHHPTDEAAVAGTRRHLDDVFGKALGSPEPWGYQRTLEFIARRNGYASHAALKAALDRGATLDLQIAESDTTPVVTPQAPSTPPATDDTIYVVEIPHQRPPSVWKAYGRAGFIDHCEATAEKSGGIFRITTVRELLAENGYESIEAARENPSNWLVALDMADRHGPDSLLAQILWEGGYTVPMPDVAAHHFDVCCEWLAHDLHACRIFEGWSEAKDGLHYLGGHGSLVARQKLRELLLEDADLDLSLVRKLEGEVAPLYRRYPGQVTPQRAYLELAEDGRVGADWAPETGNSMPIRVWAKRDLRWTISHNLSGSALVEWVMDEALPLLKRVHLGHQVEWDGRNHVGVLDDDAQEASEELELLAGRTEELCADSPVWEPGELLFGENGTIHRVIEDAACTDKDDYSAVRAAVMDYDADLRVVGGPEAVGKRFDAETREEVGRAVEEGEPRFSTAFVLSAVAAGVITREEADWYSGGLDDNA